MGKLEGKTALVTGGSRGIGLDIVRALAAEGVVVAALARDAERLEHLKHAVAGLQTRIADVADAETAPATLRNIRPDILVLNAGATPTMAPVHRQSWEQFSRTWNTDVHMNFAFGKEALTLTMAPGSVVVIVASGAAIGGGGSPLSGGYAGAKRMQLLLASYLQGQANALNRDLQFVALLPRQIMGTTDLGRAAVAAYAAHQGISEQAFLERFGPPLTPEDVGRAVVTLICGPAYRSGTAFGVSGRGLAALETTCVV